MERITKKQLQAVFEVFAAKMGHKIGHYVKDNSGKIHAQIGNWALDSNAVYGGHQITEIVNEGGGVCCPFGLTRMSTRELWNTLHFANDALSFLHK